MFGYARESFLAARGSKLEAIRNSTTMGQFPNTVF
jgi:hypothetical protein